MHIEPMQTSDGPGLLCWACGARMTLDQEHPLRSFVDEHRDCVPAEHPAIPRPRAAVRLDIDLTEGAPAARR